MSNSPPPSTQYTIDLLLNPHLPLSSILPYLSLSSLTSLSQTCKTISHHVSTYPKDNHYTSILNFLLSINSLHLKCPDELSTCENEDYGCPWLGLTGLLLNDPRRSSMWNSEDATVVKKVSVMLEYQRSIVSNLYNSIPPLESTSPDDYWKLELCGEWCQVEHNVQENGGHGRFALGVALTQIMTAGIEIASEKGVDFSPYYLGAIVNGEEREEWEIEAVEEMVSTSVKYSYMGPQEILKDSSCVNGVWDGRWSDSFLIELSECKHPDLKGALDKIPLRFEVLQPHEEYTRYLGEEWGRRCDVMTGVREALPGLISKLNIVEEILANDPREMFEDKMKRWEEEVKEAKGKSKSKPSDSGGAESAPVVTQVEYEGMMSKSAAADDEEDGPVEWVQCDICDKWHVLPEYLSSEDYDDEGFKCGDDHVGVVCVKAEGRGTWRDRKV